MSAPIVSVRRVIHPGPVSAAGVTTAMGLPPRRVMTWLAEGQSLQGALVGAYASLGARAGAFELLGGRLSVAAYHVTGPQTASVRVAEYGPPSIIPGGATIIQATGSYGDSLAGPPMVHIHAAFADESGRAHGGHVNPELCVIGPGGVRAMLTLAVGFRQVADPQTQYSLFFPFAEVSAHGAVPSHGNHPRARRERAVGAE
jgi:hypothetical protein